MSDLISAWVDEGEMRRLAESLLSRPYGHDLNQLEVDFGSQFEGFADQGAEGEVARAEVGLSRESNGQVEKAAQSVRHSPAVSESNQPAVGDSALQTQLNSSESPVRETLSPSPSVVRSAVQFLKKAQSEGKAGGVIRGANVSSVSSQSSLPPSDETSVNISVPATPDPRPIHSPFRRVSDLEKEIAEEVAPDPEVAVASHSASFGKVTRPPTPDGNDPILARVVTFGKWLKGPVGARNFFVANTEGKILIDEVANAKLIQVARSLAGASNEAGEGEIRSLHVRIGEDSILEVVPTPSQFGLLILGLIVEHPLPEEQIREIRLGLEEVANARLIKGQARK